MDGRIDWDNAAAGGAAVMKISSSSFSTEDPGGVRWLSVKYLRLKTFVMT